MLVIKLLLLQVQFANESGSMSWEVFNKVLTDAAVEKSKVEVGSIPLPMASDSRVPIYLPGISQDNTYLVNPDILTWISE